MLGNDPVDERFEFGGIVDLAKAALFHYLFRPFLA
jgi:hypothetical protein